MPDFTAGDQCPICTEPIAAVRDGPQATIHHDAVSASSDKKVAQQSRTCVSPVQYSSGELALRVFYHTQDELENENVSSRGESGGARPDAELDEEQELVYKQVVMVHQKIDESRVKRAEVAGRCLQLDMSPSQVDRILEQLVRTGVLEEPESGLFTITELKPEAAEVTE